MFKSSIFKTPTALQIAQRDLDDAKRSLLAFQATAEHATKMVEYHAGMVKRLNTYIKTETTTA